MRRRRVAGSDADRVAHRDADGDAGRYAGGHCRAAGERDHLDRGCELEGDDPRARAARPATGTERRDLTIVGAEGSITLNPDGTFGPGSKISVDMTTVTTDDRQRTDSIKRDPLEVTRFRTSELVPKTTAGLALPLALPLARSGDFAFQLTGDLTLHGVTRSVTFDVKATRSDGKLIATATADPSWKFGDFGMRPPSSFSVLSIVDEIRMEFALVANEVRA